jgi:GNAT superfamily N-acetyltransferase
VTFLIRTATPADLDDLRDVFRRSSLSNDSDRASLLANPEVLEFSADALSEGHTRAAVAGGRIIGFATAVPAGATAELDDMFVDPDWMRHGVGRALMLDIAAVARQGGVQRIEVTANKHALRFYQEVGFVIDGQVETLFGPGLRMHLEVAR